MKKPFKHIIYFLLLGIALISCTQEEAVPIEIAFDLDLFNNDYSVPVEVIVSNNTTGADTYEWIFEGAFPQESTKRNPGIITYKKKGSYQITLKTSNRDDVESVLTKVIDLNDPIVINFTVNPKENTFSPVTAIIENKTTGATNYEWFFENGTPETSSLKNPKEVIFSQPGLHTIRLTASNEKETEVLEKTITVAPLLVSDFDFEIDFESEDYQVPAKVNMINKSVSATQYFWTFTGANIASSILENPEVVFTQPGVQNIKLKVTNGKVTKEFSQEITLFKNTNLRMITDVKLGINTAHNNGTIGSFYSLSQRKVYHAEELNAENEKEIDLVYFGLNNQFTRNQFLAPDNLASTTFKDLTSAKNTKIINKQEGCLCGVNISEAQFDALEDDVLLNSLNFTETLEGSLPFEQETAKRIVVFKTQDGRKGLIKINEFVANSTNSYIEVDIKVQKEKK